MTMTMSPPAARAVGYEDSDREGPEGGTPVWDVLTPAERQVASLVGQAFTNVEVGERLFISPRTVGHHLAHIYRKLGINSRRVLIRQASRQPVVGTG